MKRILYLFAFVALVGFASCNKDDDNVKFDDVTADYGTTYSIPKGKGTTWTSSNNLIATVNGDIVNAVRAGEALISSDKGSFTFTVVPTLDLYQMPSIEWGATMATVKAYMQGYPGVSLSSEDSESLTYFASSLNQKVVMLDYSFKNNGLDMSGIAINSDFVTVDDMSSYLIQRYVPAQIDEDNYAFYFISPTADMAVAMQLTTINSTVIYMVLYTEIDSTRSAADIRSFFEIEAPANPELVKPIFDEFKLAL